MDPCLQWLEAESITEDFANSTLAAISDDLWVTTACVDKLVDDVQVQRTLLNIGIERTEGARNRVQGTISASSDTSEDSTLAPADTKLCQYRRLLLERLERLNTYVLICETAPEEDIAAEESSEEEEDSVEGLEDWEDDPWQDGDDTTTSDPKPALKPPVPLPVFLTDNLTDSACTLASEQWFHAVRIIRTRHGSDTWPLRFTLLESIPEYVQPASFRDLLPGYDPISEMEIRPTFESSPTTEDWMKDPRIQNQAPDNCNDMSTTSLSTHSNPLAKEKLLEWYKERVEHVLKSTGMVDVALATIQHGASQGLSELDELGEELSLFSRLVYDSTPGDSTEEWTLERWRTLAPADVVQAYLANSTEETVVRDISRLVMPYLFVLESRAERSGNPDPRLSTRLLHEYILSAPLPLVASIFESSKPTSPASQRLLRDDEDMVRLALSCLYGNESLDEWPTMSRIFECLPAWDINRDDDLDEDVTATTMLSLASFVTPNTRSKCTPVDLLVFFKPLPITSLSRALDILDVHLESGEIFSRWSAPAPLRWFLQSHEEIAEQRAWANRMARRAGGTHDRLTTVDDWEWLLEDMLKLAGKGDTGVRGALGLLQRKEVKQIFLSGLLSTGQFDIAKSLLYAHHPKLKMDAETIEDVCIATSHEIYDNATSGNYKFGDMKLAYDCLDVPKQTDRILKEKEFIEATSRLSSYNISIRGNPLTPIEIRLTKDRLTLVSRLLSSNPDAYKHTEVVLDLVYKLGFRGDPIAEIKALSMLADAALQAEDFSRAYETCQRMVSAVYSLSLPQTLGLDDDEIKEASEVCWVSCFQLGRQPEFDDVEKKLVLLGYTLQLCPPERIHDVLVAWRREEKEDITIREERMEHRLHQQTEKRPKQASIYDAPVQFASLASRLQDFHMPAPPLLNTPDAAALASRTFKQVAANFPFRGRSLASSSHQDRNPSESSPRLDGAMSEQASRVVSKGIGWLLGEE